MHSIDFQPSAKRSKLATAVRRAGLLVAPAVLLCATLALGGCGTVIAVADTAGTVVATGVKAGVEVVGAGVDVATGAVHAVAGSADKK